MPKARRERVKYHDSAPAWPPSKAHGDDAATVVSHATATSAALTEGGSGPLSRGQRRRRDKKSAWLRKFAFSDWVKQQQAMQEQAHAAVDFADLNDISVELDQIDQTEKRKARDKEQKQLRLDSRRKRQMVAAKEIAQFEAVSKFPAFQANPFAALRQHLANSIALKQRKEEAQSQTAQSQAGEGRPVAVGDRGKSKAKEKKGTRWMDLA